MKWMAWSTLAAAMAFAPTAFAQSAQGDHMKGATHAQAKDGTRVKGIVKSVSDGLLTVQSKAPDKHEFVFKTSSSTKVQRGDQTLALQDLKPGERVLVRAQRDQNGELSAQAIRIGQRRAAATPKADQHATPHS